AQYSVTLSKSHNTGQATFGPGGVTDDVDKVAGDDGGVAHFASTHRGNIARLGFGGVFGFATRRQIHSVSAPIYSRDPTGNSIFVSRTVFGARPAAAFWWTFWCRTLVIFRVVDTKTAHARICRSRDASCLHAAGKSGMVLAVVAMSVTSIPSTRSPTIALNVAIRWSASEFKVAACGG